MNMGHSVAYRAGNIAQLNMAITRFSVLRFFRCFNDPRKLK